MKLKVILILQTDFWSYAELSEILKRPDSVFFPLSFTSNLLAVSYQILDVYE